MGRKPRIVLVVVALTVAGALPVGAAKKPPPPVRITINNFRFCPDPVASPASLGCRPTDSAYVPDPQTGRPAFTGDQRYNPHGKIVNVRPGQTVIWTYRDNICDAFNFGQATCPGHEVHFENGKFSRGVPARHGSPTMKYKVPKTARRGSYINYYCGVGTSVRHYQFGMTGALKVV